MHMNPAVQLTHSKDLVNWELIGYCADKLDLGPPYRLEGGNITAGGSGRPASTIGRRCFKPAMAANISDGKNGRRYDAGR